jgi:hypothetical protein
MMPRYMRAPVIGTLVVAALTMAACSKSSSSNTTTTTGATTASTAAATTTTTTKATTTTAPAGRHVTGAAVTLGAGTFKGGTDVKAGLYDVTPGAGQSGNFSTTGSQTYNEILGSNGGVGGVPMVRVSIANGDQITISGLSAVMFAPVTTPLNDSHATTNLYAGTWTVGEDLGAGRYVATPGAGQSGNFSVSGNDSYNEILGGDASTGGVPQVSVTLSKGDVISISGLSQVTMTAQ